MGERISISGTEQKLAQLAYSTRGVVPDGMLVRVSSIEPDATKAYQMHQSFVADMARAIPVALQPQVIGKRAG